ncbi:MAG: NAD(+)/NADH kinase [Desulfovibrio sp.]|nr:NAD(+)/NADH kinase [Desulfovibrio sp.]
MQNVLFRRILLIFKARNAEAERLAGEIGHWLEARGLEAVIGEAVKDASLCRQNFDMVIVLGGDGTLLGVARKIAGRGIPLLGINFGRVGFLVTTQPSEWKESLTACLAGEMSVSPRLALSWKLRHHGSITGQGNAANDIVLSRGALARLVCTMVSVNGRSLGHIRSDGLILASPNGSSGYTVSAGGPLLFPRTDAVVLTPLCPFSKSVSPIVFPSDSIFEFRIDKGSTDCYITVDGQEGAPLDIGDHIEIHALPNALLFLGEDDFLFDRIRARGLAFDQ